LPKLANIPETKVSGANCLPVLFFYPGSHEQGAVSRSVFCLAADWVSLRLFPAGMIIFTRK